jgi:hypothetical protein
LRNVRVTPGVSSKAIEATEANWKKAFIPSGRLPIWHNGLQSEGEASMTVHTADDDQHVRDALEEAFELYERYIELTRISDQEILSGLIQPDDEKPSVPDIPPIGLELRSQPIGVV